MQFIILVLIKFVYNVTSWKSTKTLHEAKLYLTAVVILMKSIEL